MRNLYPGNCFKCSKPVAAGEGFFQSVGSLPKEKRKEFAGKGKWLLRCKQCINKGN